MKKNIWMMNHYAGSMLFDQGGRHYSFAKYMKRSGYAPVIFCANSRHNGEGLYFEDDALWHEHHAEQIDVPFVFVKARAYGGNGKQRVLNMVDFYCNVKKAVKEYAAQHGKPDVIYASSVHPLTLVAGIQLAKKFGVKCICEVRDLWPESIVAYGIAGPKNPAVVALRWMEKWIYKKAAAVVFTMEGAYDYIVEQGWKKEITQSKVHYINNGVDLEDFETQCIEHRLEDEELIKEGTFKIIYAGSIRRANGLSEIVSCAEVLQDYQDIKFLVYGGGDDIDYLRDLIAEKGLKNIEVKGPVPKKNIPFVLSQSSVNLLNYNPQTAHVYKYGSSQNKLFEYMASGKPILSNIAIAYSAIDDYQCGISRNIKSAAEYAEAVLELYRLSKPEYNRMCENAKCGAREYNVRRLTEKLMDVIERSN